MKVLHTADWHVGRLIRGRSRSGEHADVLAEITDLADREQVDLALVVGDLFDTAAPTAESEEIVYRALLGLAATGATVVVLSGNHDSANRLRAVEPLLELGKVHTRARFLPPADGGVVEVTSRDGQERALVACLPFLSQRHVVRADELMALDGFELQQHYTDRMHRLIAALCAGFDDPATVHLVAAHCMVAGATTVGSERAGHTVFDYAVNATAFPPSAHYVALGHLHRTQQVPGPVPTWYPGSPLQLDFGEAGDAKSVLLIDAVAGRPATVRAVPLAAGRRLRVFDGTLADLRAASLGDDWLKVRLREPARAGLADEVRAVAPHAVDVEVLSEPTVTMARAERRLGRSPVELFHTYLDDSAVADPRMEALFVELLGEVSAP